MIYELRTYTMKPGMAHVHAESAGSIGRAIRGDEYGVLVGHWLTEIGPLNQSMHLWAYEDLNDRAAKKAKLAQNQRWRSEYLPPVRAEMLRQDVRLMTAIVPPKSPEATGNIYEFRNYRLRPGCAPTWCAAFTEALPAREKYSKIVGLWHTDAGQPNEVCHIWAYQDLTSRAQAREGAAADPDWEAFLKEGSPMIEEMWSTLMLPAVHSPLK